MNHEFRDLHRGARDEHRRMVSDPHDVPDYDRATGIDNPVPDAEYGDDHPELAPDYPEETGENRVTLPIPDSAEYDVDGLEDGVIIVQWWCPVSESTDDAEGIGINDSFSLCRVRP